MRWARYVDEDTVLMAVVGFDAGYLYKYRLPDPDASDGPTPLQVEPLECAAVPGNDDLEVSSYLY